MRTQAPIFLPAEWAPQSGVQLTWPHEDTDWRDMLDEVIPCFAALARAVAAREPLLIVCRDPDAVRRACGPDFPLGNVRFAVMDTNDTWARDHAPISVFVNDTPCLYDFTFNGWGLKFPADLDNQITRGLVRQSVFRPEVAYRNCLDRVLEGGSIESDGEGTVLTTSACLLSPNRNAHFTRAELDAFYRELFGLERILWLENGYLAGDDTDSHIDTLARFCDAHTIAYVTCDDPSDEHTDALKKMEAELKAFRTLAGEPYTLIPLPMAEPAYDPDDGHRLPATYANFLILNGAVLVPTYGTPKDAVAIDQLGRAFPDREVVGIDCRPLIRQHGSLHCVTMQYPKGFLS